MKTQFAVSKLTRDQIAEKVDKMLLKTPVIVVTLNDGADSGSLSMLNLWRSWMRSTGEWFAANGYKMPLFYKDGVASKRMRPFDENDAHEAFIRHWLPTPDGGTERLSFSMKPKDENHRIALERDRWTALTKHKIYMVEKGIKHIDPADSEFRRMVDYMGI